MPRVKPPKNGINHADGLRERRMELADEEENRLLPEQFRGRMPVRKNKHIEAPWHRIAAILRAAGFSTKQIAEEVGYSHHTVYDLDRTPWFQARVTKLIEEQVGATDVLALAKARAIDAHNVIVEIMGDKTSGARVRLQAATTIMDRVFGKPLQRVENDTTVRSADPVAEVERLQKEAADLRMRLGDQAG